MWSQGSSYCEFLLKSVGLLTRPCGGGAEQAEASYNLKTMQVSPSETHEKEDNLLRSQPVIKATNQRITGSAWTLPLKYGTRISSIPLYQSGSEK